MFVSRFSRAEHVDTLVSWIEAQNQCLQKFALLSSQGLPPAIFDVGDEASPLHSHSGCFRLLQKSSQVRLFALRFRRRSAVCVERRSSCIRCFEDCDFCVQMDVAAHGATKKSLIRSALKLRMTKTLAPRLAVVASI